MSEPESKFFRTNNYLLTHAVQYLDSRGLALQDFGDGGVVAYQKRDMLWGVRTKSNQYQEFVPEGWAFRLRDEHGEWRDTYRMRVCNLPEDKEIYQLPSSKEEGARPKRKDKVAKFLDVGPEEGAPHWTTTLTEFRTATSVMVHEKITSATLAWRLLGIPSVAISGCWGWCKDQKMRKDFEKMLNSIARNTTLFICFDRDMLADGGPRESAKRLGYEIEKVRPDLVVKFLEVPEVNGTKDGWDDWVVAQGGPVEATMAWREILEGAGVELGAPHEAYIDAYKLTYRTTKDGARIAESNQDNYVKLLRHEKFSSIVFDISSRYYDLSTMELLKGVEEFLALVRGWMQSNVWPGMGVRISEGELKAAIKLEIEGHRLQSVALKILGQQPPVTEEEYRVAARDALTNGVLFEGPGDLETAITTLGRMARDLCYLWSEDHCGHIEWIHVISGIQGAGKTKFWHNLLTCLKDWGLKHEPSMILAESKKDEDIKRLTRDKLFITFDEWDKMERRESDHMHRLMYDLGTSRGGDSVEKYVERSTSYTRRAGLCVSVPEEGIGRFLTKGRGTGERRFEIWRIKGVCPDSRGLLLPDWKKLQEFGGILMRYGHVLYLQGDRENALINNLETMDEFRADHWAVDDIISCNVHGVEPMLKAFEEWIMGRPSDGVRYMIVAGEAARKLQYSGGGTLSSALRRSYKDLMVDCGGIFQEKSTKMGEESRRNVIIINDVKDFMRRLREHL